MFGVCELLLLGVNQIDFIPHTHIRTDRTPGTLVFFVTYFGNLCALFLMVGQWDRLCYSVGPLRCFAGCGTRLPFILLCFHSFIRSILFAFIARILFRPVQRGETRVIETHPIPRVGTRLESARRGNACACVFGAAFLLYGRVMNKLTAIHQERPSAVTHTYTQLKEVVPYYKTHRSTGMSSSPGLPEVVPATRLGPLSRHVPDETITNGIGIH